MQGFVLALAGFVILCPFTQGHAANVSEEHLKSSYTMLLEQVDTNKDGKLAVAECMSIYKNPSMAEKNCTFWDVDKDGFIKQDEYVSQVKSLGNKK
jgi:Ca2+-binding EF-hand superfamily protein